MLAAFSVNLLKFLLALYPTLIMFYILVELFPNTGLGRILVIPFVFLLNTGIILVGIILMSILKTSRYMVWSVIVFLTLLTTVVFYPQENEPHVILQMLEWVT